jgi:hypothetical protein
MDIETKLINNVHTPYLICWYDGNQSYSYFINKFKESDITNMIKRAMEDICIKKYKGYKVYLHNFAKFDAYFLIKHLSKIGLTSPQIHKGRIISCKFSLYNNLKNEIVFYDSLLLLPSSLRKLGISFGLNQNERKGIFPFYLTNVDYVGLVPDINLFDKVSLEEYNTYKHYFKNKE